MISTDKRREVAERLQGMALCGNVKYAEQFRDKLIELLPVVDAKKDGAEND